MLKEYLECGKIVSTHGVKGELKVLPWADDPSFFKEFATLYLGKEKEKKDLVACRTHKDMALLTLEGVDTMEKAQLLRGQIIYILRKDAKLEEGDYFHQDLLEMEVVDQDSGICYGTISEISQTGANDVYHIRGKDGVERLIPAIPQVVISVDLTNQVMRIKPLEGLFDHED